MLRKAEIESHLRALAAELTLRNTKGEICLYGGAVMCLAFDARPATRDVDAVFAPTSVIREAAYSIASRHGLPDDWLNDAVKGFVVPHERRVLLDLPSLKIFVPEAEYMLAMKALAARADASDRDDVRFLIKHLAIKDAEQVFAILRRFYPREVIRPATQFFIEELFEAFQIMISISDAWQQMHDDPEHAMLLLMDFVDDFRRERDVRALATPFPRGTERFDALLAATAEELCKEAKIEPPLWLDRVPSCREPWFPSGLEGLKAIALVESPLPFRIRQIFVLENFLSRA